MTIIVTRECMYETEYWPSLNSETYLLRIQYHEHCTSIPKLIEVQKPNSKTENLK